MALELHFFHGFLGGVGDWNGFHEYLPNDLEIVEHDLVEDVSKDPSINSFLAWKSFKEAELKSSSAKKVLVGYSLGGRLCSHLTSNSYDALILIGSHWGLNDEKEVRLQKDLEWSSKGRQVPQSDWLENWNSQEIFKNDRVRPERRMNQNRFLVWMDIMNHFSLGRQENLSSLIIENSEKLYWLYGSDDRKFSKLAEKWSELIGSEKVIQIPESGHGAIFDNPQFVAQFVEKVIENVD